MILALCCWLFYYCYILNSSIGLESKLPSLQLFVSVMQIDSDKTIMVTLKHDDKLQDGSECAFQVPTNFSAVCQGVFNLHIAPLLCEAFSILLIWEDNSSFSVLLCCSFLCPVCPSLHHCLWPKTNSSYNIISAMHKYTK